MPGEIGASRFSPRPGLGYRFHSLQVEIIAFPSRRARRNQPNQKFFGRRPPPIWPCSERLTKQWDSIERTNQHNADVPQAPVPQRRYDQEIWLVWPFRI